MKTSNYFLGKHNMKHLGSLAAFCFILALNAVTFAQSTKPNFSGKWILNKEKSQPNSSTDAKAIDINQDNDTITFIYIFTNDGINDYSYTYKYTIDGSTSTTYDEFGWEDAVAKWSENGRSFTISSSYYDDEYEDYDEDSWDEYTISEDSKTLTTKHTGDFGTRIKVYDKAIN